MTRNLVFLKLGGSLITDKNVPRHAKQDVLDRLTGEIDAALKEQPDLKLLLGHGSGSFGHIPADMFQTRRGVNSPAQWRGFAKVWYEARSLNNLVMESLHAREIPAIAFPASSQVVSESSRIIAWDTTQIRTTLNNSVLPVVFGDVVFDRAIGGTILSTEEQFEYLAAIMKPERILLAGIESGVWKDFPTRNDLVKTITPENLPQVHPNLTSSESPDVTGGMRSKVQSMMNLITADYCREVLIFSGTTAGNVHRALSGEPIGTRFALE